MGLTQFSGTISGKPQTGYFWSDTGTTEERTLLDETSLGTNYLIGAEIVFNTEHEGLLMIGAKYMHISVDIDDFDISSISSMSCFIGFGKKFEL